MPKVTTDNLGWYRMLWKRGANRMIWTIGQNKIINWDMSAPRMPEWLNKGDKDDVNDEEIGIEVSYSTLCYNGESETPMDRYEDM
jgi:hypothetical protein